MAIHEYEYSLEQCDVPKVRHGRLEAYRAYRRKCLEYLHGDANTSVKNQVHDLAWHTAVFRTLNEARRLEEGRVVNGAMWELITAGYASLMTLGIRRLIDRGSDVDSLWNAITQIQKRPELLTREMYVCYDGLPFEYEAGREKEFNDLISSGSKGIRWRPTKGPKAWDISERMHASFDSISQPTKKRKRGDKIESSILEKLKFELEHPAIQSVRTMADKQVAHAERIAEGSEAIPIVTYNDIDAALKQIVRIANEISSKFFWDQTFVSVVPHPQFDVLKALDEPWITTKNLPALHKHWEEICLTMDDWVE